MMAFISCQSPTYLGQRMYHFDAGASSLNVGLGVASLDCFTTLWARHGIDFDFVEAWEPTTDPQRFFKTVPAAWISREPAISREERCQVLVPGTRARYSCQPHGSAANQASVAKGNFRSRFSRPS